MSKSVFLSDPNKTPPRREDYVLLIERSERHFESLPADEQHMYRIAPILSFTFGQMETQPNATPEEEMAEKEAIAYRLLSRRVSEGWAKTVLGNARYREILGLPKKA